MFTSLGVFAFHPFHPGCPYGVFSFHNVFAFNVCLHPLVCLLSIHFTRDVPMVCFLFITCLLLMRVYIPWCFCFSSISPGMSQLKLQYSSSLFLKEDSLLKNIAIDLTFYQMLAGFSLRLYICLRYIGR